MRKILSIILTVTICSFFLISCDDNKKEQEEIQTLKEQVQIAKIEHEKERMAKEKAKKEAASMKSSFNLLIGVSVSIVILALVIGIAMGSKARKGARNQTVIEENEDGKPTK